MAPKKSAKSVTPELITLGPYTVAVLKPIMKSTYEAFTLMDWSILTDQDKIEEAIKTDEGKSEIAKAIIELNSIYEDCQSAIHFEFHNSSLPSCGSVNSINDILDRSIEPGLYHSISEKYLDIKFTYIDNRYKSCITAKTGLTYSAKWDKDLFKEIEEEVDHLIGLNARLEDLKTSTKKVEEEINRLTREGRILNNK